MTTHRDIGSRRRKEDFLALAYGMKVNKKFKCKDCGHEFKVVQRGIDVDEFEKLVSPMMSDWFQVKLKGNFGKRFDPEQICYFFYFDCPECFKRNFTCVYNDKMYSRLEHVKFWSNLLGYEYGHEVDNSMRIVNSRMLLKDRIERLKSQVSGQYIKDKNTGLYSLVEFYDERSLEVGEEVI